MDEMNRTAAKAMISMVKRMKYEVAISFNLKFYYIFMLYQFISEGDEAKCTYMKVSLDDFRNFLLL